MKIMITYVKGAKLIMNFTNEQYAQEYLKAQEKNIKSYVVLG